MTIEFLLRRHAATGDQRPLAVARRSLDAMADGGIHDQLGGGFHRYSTDAEWLVPHFEQMLYDNAQLARVYVHAWALTGDARYRAVATGTLDYMLRELRTPDGAFAASQDADTEGIEGLTFTWRATEVAEVLGEDAPLFEAAYGVTEAGNWEGVTILSRVVSRRRARRGLWRRRRGGCRAARTRPGAAPRTTRRAAATRARRQGARGVERTCHRGLRGRLRRPRGDRCGPRRAVSLGCAGCCGDRRRRPAVAGGCARAVMEGRPGGRSGRPRGLHAPRRRPACALRGDFRGALVHGGPRPDGPRAGSIRRSRRWVLRHSRRPRTPRHPAQGRPGQRRSLWERDGGTRPPSPRRLDRRGSVSDAAERALRTVVQFVGRYPTGFAQWLSAMDLSLAPGVEVAIVGSLDDAATGSLLAEVRRGFRPNQVVSVAADPSASVVPLLADRVAVGGRPTAYVCRQFVCRLPVTDAAALREQLDAVECLKSVTAPFTIREVRQEDYEALGEPPLPGICRPARRARRRLSPRVARRSPPSATRPSARGSR